MSMSTELVDLETEDEQVASNQRIVGKHLSAMMGLPHNPSHQEEKMQENTSKASGSASLMAVQSQARPRLHRAFQFSADVEKFLSAKECESFVSTLNFSISIFFA